MKSVASDTCAAAYLIAGAGGMLGTALQRVLAGSGSTFFAPATEGFDITDPSAVHQRLAEFAETLAAGQLGVVVNAAAFTDVERAEDDLERAYLVNEHGPMLLADAALEVGLQLVHISTDFVFDGRKHGPYVESDRPNPLSVYGASKLAGEIAVQAEYPEALIVRTAWVFGPGGANFPAKILGAARTRPLVQVVTDEVGCPTYTLDLAAGIIGLIAAEATGLFHLAGSGSCTRFELAAETLRLAGVDTRLEPVTSDVFPSRARRPLNSVLECGKAAALGVTLPHWRDGLSRFLLDLGQTRS
jgi:dTDP-4-dehydrorhamnose reductase